VPQQRAPWLCRPIVRKQDTVRCYAIAFSVLRVFAEVNATPFALV
jgi:hypothetical protein